MSSAARHQLSTTATGRRIDLRYPAFDVFYLGWVVAINLILYGLSLLMLVWRIAS
jgi:hypothetical protein